MVSGPPRPRIATPSRLPAQPERTRTAAARVPSRRVPQPFSCSRLEHGFIRVKRDGCEHELLVALSCRNRGFCTAGGAPRMAETGAHLVAGQLIEHVSPVMPVRQWILRFSRPRRMRITSRLEALTRWLDVVVRSIDTPLQKRASPRRASGARTGVVALIQRHGSAANLDATCTCSCTCRCLMACTSPPVRNRVSAQYGHRPGAAASVSRAPRHPPAAATHDLYR